ncbi:MAG TPA: type I restriction enzyme HsdR N-terminal domain-containing protein [Daejeonella sp.]|nr:type I restriction enzyme HsdR N-terminal domain-containing protein [Daejeonella sp.]
MFQPVPLNLPSYPFRLKEENGINYIFDEIRKKFLVLTPEEWVRQHVVQYLIQKDYPRSLMKLEGGLVLNSLQKRSDILLYNNLGEKIMLVECKAPHIKITQETFDQVARYNFVHRVKWLLVSNGLQHFCCEVNFSKGNYRFVEETPFYSEH